MEILLETLAYAQHIPVVADGKILDVEDNETVVAAA